MFLKLIKYDWNKKGKPVPSCSYTNTEYVKGLYNKTAGRDSELWTKPDILNSQNANLLRLTAPFECQIKDGKLK